MTNRPSFANVLYILDVVLGYMHCYFVIITVGGYTTDAKKHFIYLFVTYII